MARLRKNRGCPRVRLVDFAFVSDKRPPGALGLDLRSKDPRPCGLCGDLRRMSRAHVPPQVAGNSRDVTSSIVLIANGIRRNGRSTSGGVWVRGLCEKCNSLAGARYDSAYGDFVQRIRSYGRLSGRFHLPEPWSPPAVSVAPGRVARSVMFGMFAISPHLRELFPELAADLSAGRAHITIPDKLSLRYAMYPDRVARLTGPVYSQRVLGRREHYRTFAEIFFPPLAWVLTSGDHLSPGGAESILDLQGWAEATTWLRYGDDVTSTDLRNLCRRLPVVTHPLSDPSEWLEMFSDEITPILEGIVPM